MKTIKQVSDLTGISVRMLHHYDKIGLLKPSAVTEAKYRLYDDQALETLQQILFFKELDIPLKKVKGILASPQYDKVQALCKQKELLTLKRDRLDGLISLIEKKLKGGNEMSFKEFDMSEYFSLLETYKQEHADEIVRYYGSVDEFNEILKDMQSNELKMARMAVKQFGSVENYTESMKNNLHHLPSLMEGYQRMKENVDDHLSFMNQLTNRLTSDLSKDPCSTEIQNIVKEMDDLAKEQHEMLNMDMGENYWGVMAEFYLTNPDYIKIYDKKHGKGASKFMGAAFKFYSESSN
ncbi:MerR family transcriptional regulator [Paenibacillus sp. YN15]|uniref:MerR family transcriptional regulator n=1 Tax=Paenibacillus sp. YN15 TaxID=1742774 RepID=UPI000DCF30B5|nr:MerR family transcriptional regulator [Paenibacillus sp. YN15]RAU98088.1 MerR family transcriptional regulator [Paenibacillus sp. YN15]